LAVSSNTSPFGQQWSPVAPPLTPGAKRIFGERRNLANRSYGLTVGEANLMRGESEARDVFERGRLRKDIAKNLRSGLTEIAGRGLGYSPMFSGRIRRDAAQYQQQEEAGMSMSLAERIAELQRMVNRAEIDRDRELLSITAEEAAQKAALQLASLAGG
jgi:hypothetical protein